MPVDENAYDWSRFNAQMLYATNPEQIYDYWATSHGMERFFTKVFTYSHQDGAKRDANDRAQIGDEYHLVFHHPSELQGHVLVAKPGEHFAFTFGSMRVDVRVEPHPRGTCLGLTQSNIPTDDLGRAKSHLNCRSCWIYYLLNLRSVVEYGNDLRDEGLPDNPVSIHFEEKVREGAE